MSDTENTAALEDTAVACARLIDALRTSRAPTAVLHEVQARIDAVSALLEPHLAAGPHSQSAFKFDPRDYFARHLLESHQVMPFSPVIGRCNPVSARMVFEAVDGRIVGHGVIPVRFVGAPQTAHGGYVATVLDELMGMVNMLNGEASFTGTMTVKYHRPTPIERPLELVGETTGRSGRKISSRAEIRCDGELTASAEALFIRPHHFVTAHGQGAPA